MADPRFFAPRFDAGSEPAGVCFPPEAGQMRVQGEAFLLINGAMDFLSLWLAACVGRARFRPWRGLLSSALGAAYAVVAWMLGGAWRGSVSLLAACLGMTFIAFGRDVFRMAGLTFSCGLMLSGAAAWLAGQGIGPTGTVMLCVGAAVALGSLVRRRRLPGKGEVKLLLTHGGKTVCLPAIRDSGNLLRFGGGNLPAAAVPYMLIRPLLPPGADPKDLATLPRGWRLIRLRTAAGEKTAMAFEPDGAALIRGRKKARVRLAVAVAETPGRFALVPEEIFGLTGKGGIPC